MAYSADWVAKAITIPTADLTLVSGNHYSLGMSDFLAEIRRLEWAFDEGLWAPAIVDHSNTRFNFAGANYAPFDEMINGYTVQVSGTATRVDLLGSNNNIIDVLIATGVSIVPSNSAGLQIVSSGSGLSSPQDTKLTSIFNYLDSIEGGFNHAELMRLLLSAVANKLEGANTSQLKFKDLAGSKNRLVMDVDNTGRTNVVSRDLS